MYCSQKIQPHRDTIRKALLVPVDYNISRIVLNTFNLNRLSTTTQPFHYRTLCQTARRVQTSYRNEFYLNKAINNTSRGTVRQMSISTGIQKYVVTPTTIPTVDVVDKTGAIITDTVFPIHRIYCVAKNYADHVRELGDDPAKEPPCFFTKPPDAIVNCPMITTTDTDNANSSTITKIQYPLVTTNLHYEIELVIAIGKDGVQVSVSDAMDYVYGYAVGCDLTRRDMQSIAKKNGRPWDSSKAFDQSAPIGCIYPKEVFDITTNATITLHVNNTLKQSSTINQMIWDIPHIVSYLSNEFHLKAGDLIYTGTPAGIGPIIPGDIVTGAIDGIGSISFQIV